MKNNSKPPSRLRPSPNELQRLLNQEREKWRIFRIQQVREQARLEAQRVREAVRAKEKEMIEQLSREVKQQWEVEKENKVTQLEKKYQNCMRNIGQAHRLAAQQPDPNKLLEQQAQHNRQLAVLRGQEAGKQHQEEVKQQHHWQNTLLKQRQEALRLEKLRASRVANLPMPKAFRKKTVVEEKPQQRVAFHEAGTFTTTHYVPQNIRVEKEVWSSKPNAKEMAAAEEAEKERLERERKKQAEENYLRREERGKEALRKEQLTRLLQHLTAGLDEAQRQRRLSQFLNGRDGPVMETKECLVKEQNRQQREMEKAVENLLQKEMEEKEEEKEEYPFPDSCQLSSECLEEIESSGSNEQEAITGAKVRGLRSLLEDMERRRRRILQEVENSIPVRGKVDSLTGGDESDGDSPGDRTKSVHLAETIPVHLHPGHPPTRGPLEDSSAGQPPPSSSLQCEERTTELPDSPSTVLPLSDESIPLSIGSALPSTSPSLSHRCSTPALPRDTHVKQPNLARSHTTTTDRSLCGSEEIKINVDLDIGSSSLVGSDTTLEQNQHQEQQAESLTSSTEYYSPPSELPRRQLSLQEIEDNLKRIQENRQHNWNLLNQLSWKRGLSGSHTPITTYLEKLKEEGSGKKPITRKEKFERQKRELIQFYIQSLLQRGSHEGDLSASSVEGSGLCISSLGSLLSYLEGKKKEKDLPTDSPSTSSASASSTSMTSRSLSAYEDIDEFPVRMRSRERVHLPLHFTTTPSFLQSVHKDPHYTTTSVVPPATTHFSSSISSPSFPSQLQHYLSSSSSSTHPSHHISKPPIHTLDFVSSSRQKQELSVCDFVSTANGSSTCGSPEQISTESEGSWRHSLSHSYLTPISEDESSVKEYEAASELDTTTTTTATKQDERMKWDWSQRLRPHHLAETTTSSGDSSWEATSKLPKLSREYRLSDFGPTDTTRNSPPLIIHTNEDTKRDTTNISSKSSGAKLSGFSGTFQSLEGDQSPCLPVVTSVTSYASTAPFSQPVNHSQSSEDSSVSMPDMREVLRRFGLEGSTSKSSTTTQSSEEEEK